MAAPKKCKSLMKRRIAHGDKMKNKKAKAFNGMSVQINNLFKCDKCQSIVKSHHKCYKCTISYLRNVYQKNYVKIN